MNGDLFGVTVWSSEESSHGQVLLVKRLRNGTFENHRLPPLIALADMQYDPRNGTEVIGAWIVWGDELDIWE